MDFAKKQLQKYGWTEGDALGKDGSGIKEPVKPKLKFNTNGIGYSYAEECFPWWEHVYDNAASNLTSIKDNDGTSRLKPSPSSTKLPTKVNKYGKNITKCFTKGGTLLKDGSIVLENEKIELRENVSSKIHSTNDDELLKICGGRTAHKGARHGITSRGKLGRIEKQEKLLLKQMLARAQCK